MPDDRVREDKHSPVSAPARFVQVQRSRVTTTLTSYISLHAAQRTKFDPEAVRVLLPERAARSRCLVRVGEGLHKP